MSTGFLKFFYHALSGVRVQKVQRVLRVQRVADCRSAAMLIKSALRDLLSVSYGMISILLIGSLRSPPPYPAAPDFPPKGETTHYDLCVAGAPSNHVRCASTGKRVTRFSGRFAPLRIVFPCHPCSGGRIGFYAFLQRHGSMAKHP